MPAKGKAADKGAAAKGKGKGKVDEEEKGGKVKGAQYISVRHILVSCHLAVQRA
jgi:peptidyl-prolyl cis-trans isomerase NIMA-interacting 4